MVRRVDKERYDRATMVSRSIVNAEDEARRAKTERLKEERLRLQQPSPPAPLSASKYDARVQRPNKLL